jgi:hypothetical protein
MTTALIILAGLCIVAACAVAFLTLMAPRADNELPDDVLGGDAFVFQPDRFSDASPDPVTGRARGLNDLSESVPFPIRQRK